ncbi:hypothetical protein [Nocardia sp. NPDC005366]|uniref:hypothetical protein n=1 Tax=Nocardia sp. NPDC005366 TaxID=3156878 RepID=UPI0033A31EEA
MGGRTTKGYPVPADHNPDNLPEELVFPWGPAATLVTTGEKIGVPGIRELVDSIQAMLGNPNNVVVVTSAWRTSVQELTSAVDGSGQQSIGLQTAKDELGSRWNGTAREAAVSYVDRVITTTNSIRDVIKSIAADIDGLRSVILANYKAAIELIVQYAKIVVETSGGIAAAADDIIKLDFTGVIKTLTKTLTDFMDLARKNVDAVITFRDTVQTKLESIRTSAAAIPIQAAIAPAAIDIGSWQPRKPTGKAFGDG